MENPPTLRVLIVEDSEDDAELIVRLIRKGGYTVHYERIQAPEQMKNALDNKQWDFIISDYKMPNFSGIKALEILKEYNLDIPFILVSGTIGEQIAVEAMKKGANDYLMKDNLSRLVPAIEREIKECKIRIKESNAQKEILRLNRLYSVLSDINEMIVRSHDKQEIFDKACQIAIDKGKFELSWIGLFSEDNNSIKPIAFAGLKDFVSLFSKANSENIKWSESFTINTINSGKIKVFNDIRNHPKLGIWKDYFIKTGLKSMAIVPLKSWEGKIGAYFLHSNEINFFNKGEIQLLEDLADDISFAIESIEREAKRKQTEDLLKESEEKYRELANSLPEIIFETDEKGNLTFVNKNAYDIMGYTKEDLDYGLNALQMLIPEDRERASENIQKIIGGMKIEGKEYTALRKDDSTFPVILHSNRIMEKNKPIGLSGIIFDITEKKKAEDKIRESEEKYRELVENANSIIAKFDKYGKILSMNEFGLKFFGYTEEELMGKTWIETILPEVESTGKILETLATDIAKDINKYGVNLNENIKKNGERIWIYWTNKPILDKNGEISGILSVGTDITDKIRAEKQMEQNVEYFAHLVDHIRNPLAILSGFIQVKLDDEETKNRLMKQIDRIEDMIKQLDTGWMDTEETRKFLKKNR